MGEEDGEIVVGGMTFLAHMLGLQHITRQRHHAAEAARIAQGGIHRHDGTLGKAHEKNVLRRHATSDAGID